MVEIIPFTGGRKQEGFAVGDVVYVILTPKLRMPTIMPLLPSPYCIYKGIIEHRSELLRQGVYRLDLGYGFFEDSLYRDEAAARIAMNRTFLEETGGSIEKAKIPLIDAARMQILRANFYRRNFPREGTTHAD